MRHPSKLGKHVIEEEETEFGSPTAFDFQASTATDFQTSIIHSQLRVVNNAFVIDKLYLMSLNLQKTKKKKIPIMLLLNRKKKIMLKEN